MAVFPRLHWSTISFILLAAFLITPPLSHIFFGGSGYEHFAYYALAFSYVAGVIYGFFTLWHLCRLPNASDSMHVEIAGGALRRYWLVAVAVSAIVASVVTVAAEDSLNGQHAYWLKLLVVTDSPQPPKLAIRYGKGPNDVEDVQWQPSNQGILSVRRVSKASSNLPIEIDQFTVDTRSIDMNHVAVDGGIHQGNTITLTATDGMLRWPVLARRVSFRVWGGAELVRFYWLDQTKDITVQPASQTVSFDMGGSYQGWALIPPQEINSLSIASDTAQPGTYTISGQLLTQPQQRMRFGQVHFENFIHSSIIWAHLKPINVVRPSYLIAGWACIFFAVMLFAFLLFLLSAHVSRKWELRENCAAPREDLRAFSRTAALILTVCVLYHLAFVLAVRIGFTNDSIGYYAMGREFLRSPSLEDVVAVRTPGYPVLIALVLWVFGDTAWGIALLQHLALASLSMVTLWCVWDRLPHRWAVIAAVLAGIAPAVGAMGNILWTEALFSLFACSAALFAACFDRGFVYVLLAGICTGAATMFRPNGVLLLVVIGGVVLLHFLWGRGKRSIVPYVSAGVLLLGGYFMAAAPWHMYLALNRHTFVLGKGLKEFGAWAGYIFQDQMPVDLPINRPNQAIYADPEAYRNEPYVAKAAFPLVFGDEISYDRETEREWLASQGLAPYVENLKYYATLAWHPDHLRFQFKEIRWFLESWGQPSTTAPPGGDDLQRLLSKLTVERPATLEILRRPCLTLSEFVLDHWIYLAFGAAVGIVMSTVYPWLLPIWMFVVASVLAFSINLIPGERYIAVLEPLYYVLCITGLHGLWVVARKCGGHFLSRATAATSTQRPTAPHL